jgi:hypothetical protein
VITKAGAAKGYSCHYFLVPDRRMFIIILTDASGIIDASSQVGQYILQEVLQTDSKIDVARQVEKLRRKRMKELQKSLLNPDTVSKFGLSEIRAIEGTYQHRVTNQTILINSHPNKEELNVYLEAGSAAGGKRSAPLRLVKDVDSVNIDSVLRIVPRKRQDYGPDTYVTWWGISFRKKMSDSKVSALLASSVDSDQTHPISYERIS